MPTATWHTPSSSRQEGIHNDDRRCCIWCICGHSCTGTHFFGICTSKSRSLWMNLSSCWPTTVWFQLLLCQYQLIVACCNLFSCNGALVLCVCWHMTIIVAVTVIMIVKWHWCSDTFNGLTTLIIVLGVIWLSSRRVNWWLEFYWCRRVECIKVVIMIIMSNDSVWLMCCCWWHICYYSLLAILRKKVGEPKEEIRNLYGFHMKSSNKWIHMYEFIYMTSSVLLIHLIQIYLLHCP